MCGASVQTVLQPGAGGAGHSFSQLRDHSILNQSNQALGHGPGSNGNGGGYQSVPVNFGTMGSVNNTAGNSNQYNHNNFGLSQSPVTVTVPNHNSSNQNNISTIEIVVKSPGGTGSKVTSTNTRNLSSPVQQQLQ